MTKVDHAGPLDPVPKAKHPAGSFTATILGDTRIELRTTIDARFCDIKEDLMLFSPSAISISGTAVSMAAAASRVFHRTRVITRIGQDSFTPSITAVEQASSAEWHFIIDGASVNPPIVTIRDAAPHRPGGVRLLVAGLPAPGRDLKVEEVEERRSLMEDSDVLFVDGYSMLTPTSRVAVMLAVSTAIRAGGRVCLDLVPHHIDQLVPTDQVFTCANSVDFVICEARTLSRLLHDEVAYPFGVGDLRRLLPALHQIASPRSVWLLRFGQGDLQETAVCRAGRILDHYETGYLASTDRVGFGDRLAVGEITGMLAERKLA